MCENYVSFKTREIAKSISFLILVCSASNHQPWISINFCFPSLFLYFHPIHTLRMSIIYDQTFLECSPNNNTHCTALSLKLIKISHFLHRLTKLQRNMIEYVSHQSNENDGVYCYNNGFFFDLCHAAVKWHHLCSLEWAGHVNMTNLEFSIKLSVSDHALATKYKLLIYSFLIYHIILFSVNLYLERWMVFRYYIVIFILCTWFKIQVCTVVWIIFLSVCVCFYCLFYFFFLFHLPAYDCFMFFFLSVYSSLLSMYLEILFFFLCLP